ncbi:ATP-dependent Clp protease ATP-binding subunit [Candidatus Falkowbacteria bacterium]|jgi:ATP-dependent Clp protease ATP-binding subunit ClpC|nr:ATP-dependent Clp protease ATP-binding subunit [Candidatus Falkowbacteria bacterium]
MIIEKTKPEQIVFTPDSSSGRPGTWFLGRFLYWEKDLKWSLIKLENSKKRLEKILEFFTWLIIFAGWLAFALWILRNQAVLLDNPIRIFFFWAKKDPLIFCFLLSLWFDLFLFYKKSEAKASVKKINYHNFASSADKNSNSPKRYNVAKACSDEVIEAIEEAFLLADKLKQAEVTAIHLFRVLLKKKEVQALFIRLNVNAKKLVELLDRQLINPADKFSGRSQLSSSLEEVLILSFIEAFNLEQDNIKIIDLIPFCYERDPRLAEILYELEVDADKLMNTVEWFRVNQIMLDNYNNYRRLAILKPGTGMDRAYTAIATPTLDHFSHDLTIQSKYDLNEICVGRKKEIRAIFEAFTGGHSGVLLVGSTGVGKSAIIHGLARLMVEEKVPDFLKDKRLVELDVSRLVSGADPAMAEERLLMIINEINRSRNIILYIDNIENLIGISAGSRESLDLSEVLAESLSRRHLLCLASATTENYVKYIENKALGSVMTTVGVKEPDFNQTIQILESKVGYLESKYDIFIVYSALEQAVKMSERYLHDKALPFKAINLLEKAALIAAKNRQNNPDKNFCSGEEVALAVEEMTGILVNKITIDESQKLLTLEKEIHKRLIGQEEAVTAVAASLRRARTALKDEDRPIASFLFLGPTGVGKTELAKAVSEIYFGDADYLIRVDMSEYQHPDSVRKMIGDVDGTLGYLTEAVRKKPFSLILLDEIEKAHPDILHLFLQLFDDGRLTDGQGRTINFSESIIIATSNIGALYIQEQIKAKTKINIIKQELIDNQLNKYMRPELINRFDGIIVFKPLTKDNVIDIATLMLKKIKKNLGEKGIYFKADKDGVAILAQEGYDPKFGARPLRRLLQDRVENIIAHRILSGELKRRDTVVINSRAEIEIEKAQAL